MGGPLVFGGLGGSQGINPLSIPQGQQLPFNPLNVFLTAAQLPMASVLGQIQRENQGANLALLGGLLGQSMGNVGAFQNNRDSANLGGAFGLPGIVPQNPFDMLELLSFNRPNIEPRPPIFER